MGDLKTSKSRVVALREKPSDGNGIVFSRFGTFVVVNPERPAKRPVWIVYNSRSGRELWRFSIFPPVEFRGLAPQTENFILSGDETQIAVYTGQNWEIRAISTGHLLKKLRALPDFIFGAFSPDNRTLIWGDENENIWRQRIR